MNKEYNENDIFKIIFIILSTRESIEISESIKYDMQDQVCGIEVREAQMMDWCEIEH